MYSAILPWSMTAGVLALTILCIENSHNTSFLQDRPVLTINTEKLRIAFEDEVTATPTIHDVYIIYIQNYCYGDIPMDTENGTALVNFECTTPSIYSKFLPCNQIIQDLNASHSDFGVDFLPFFLEAQLKFTDAYNLQLHVAFVFYILGAVWTCLALLGGLAAFWEGLAGAIMPIFTGSATICLLISSAIVTGFQDQASTSMHSLNENVYAYPGQGFLAFTWAAFALSLAVSVTWYLAGMASVAFRDTT